jgi:hypothetical protein
MYQLLLHLLLVIMLLAGVSGDQIVKVEIVIPPQFVPYYNWLLSFPGLPSLPKAPQRIAIPIEIGRNQPGTHSIQTHCHNPQVSP